MDYPVILLIISIVALFASLYRYIPRHFAKKKYDAEFHAQNPPGCVRMEEMPHIELPWYKPPVDGLATAKTWVIVSSIALLISLVWLCHIAL